MNEAKLASGCTGPSDCYALQELADTLEMWACMIREHCSDPDNGLPCPHRMDDWMRDYRDQYAAHNAGVSSSGDEPEYAPRDCSVISLLSRDGKTIRSLNHATYHKLKDSGMLWELYPNAPDVFPSQNARNQGLAPQGKNHE